jgi:hypothetical protein
MPTTEEYDALVAEFRSMLNDVLAALPPGAVQVDQEEGGPGGVAFILTPRRPGAARVEVMPDTRLYASLFCGEHTTVEVFDRDDVVALARDYLEDVIAGRFTEIVWTRHGVVRSAKGFIGVPPRRGRWRDALRQRSGEVREQIEYLPYE